MSISYNLNNGLPIFKALSSEIRIKILFYIYNHEGLNIKQLAKAFEMPITTISPHLKVLENCSLIRILETSTGHGWQKCCYTAMNLDSLVIDLSASVNSILTYHMDIPVGSYSDFEVSPTCGLASPTAFIGLLDEPRYFAHPNHTQARILWFTTGYLEYILPCFLPYKSEIIELSLSFEICSECRAVNNDWPSDIHFSLNGTPLGFWTSPGDFGDRKGKHSPDWWHIFMNQYGLLKTLRITSDGTYVDDEKISDVTIKSLALTDESILKFRISVPPDCAHPGGCTLFGQGFGDFSQNIQGIVKYRSIPDSTRACEHIFPAHG